DDAHNFEILRVRHKTKAHVLPDCAAIRKKAFGEASANDDEARMLVVTRQLKVATTHQTDAQGVEETRPDYNSTRHHVETRVRIFRGDRDFLLFFSPYRRGDGNVR